MKKPDALTRRVSSNCSFETSTATTSMSTAAHKDLESGSVASARSRGGASLRSNRSSLKSGNTDSQPKSRLLSRVYKTLFVIQIMYFLDMHILRRIVPDEYGETRTETQVVLQDDTSRRTLPPELNHLTYRYGYLTSQGRQLPFYPDTCKPLDGEGGVLTMVWAYDDPPDDSRFALSLNSLQPNTRVHILCGSTECMERAQSAASGSSITAECVHTSRLNVVDFARDSPLQPWVEHHVLAKLLAAHHFEEPLQIATQLLALWNYGGTALQPGTLFSRSSLGDCVGVCADGKLIPSTSRSGFLVLGGSRRSVMVEELMADFLRAYHWSKPIHERYNPYAWPLTIDWDKALSLTNEQRMTVSCPAFGNFVDGLPVPRYYGTLSYDERRKFLLSRNNTGMNVGDETQGLAGIQMLPRIDGFVERDRLDLVKFAEERSTRNPEGKVHAFLNAWWGTPSMTWPPPSNLAPVTLAMHFQPKIQEKVLELETVEVLTVKKEQKVSTWNKIYMFVERRIIAIKLYMAPWVEKPYVPRQYTEPVQAYAPFLKSQEPIGARDTKTLEFLRNHGVNAIFTACMTMTLSLPKMERDGSILIVDVADKEQLAKVVPDHILGNATFLTQKLLGSDAENNLMRYSLAFERLVKYAKAKLVITGRLHVGMPAVALGTPTIFVHSKFLPGGGGNRLDGLDDFMHVVKGTQGVEDFDWNNPPANPRQEDFYRYMGRLKQMATCHPGISDSSRKFGMMPPDWNVGDEHQVCRPGSENPDAIHIATTLDSNFFDLVFPSWLNALSQSNHDQDVILYVLTVDLSEKQRCLLRLMVHKLMPSCTIYTLPVDVGAFEQNYQTKNAHVPIVTQSRLRLPSLLPCLDKILWLDLDAFAVGNLRTIYDQEIAPCGVNARSSKAKYMNDYDVGNYKWNFRYGDSFNAGVMLLDLKRLRQVHFEESVVDYWAMMQGFNDQVTFNMACNGTHGVLNHTMSTASSVACCCCNHCYSSLSQTLSTYKYSKDIMSKQWIFSWLLCVAVFCVVAPGTSAYDWDCNLHCYHDGKCMHGKGQFGSYAGVAEDETMPWEKEGPQPDGMYCSCPVGYTGLQCEIKLKVCGGDEGEDTHTCFNGSECQKDRAGDGTIFYRCECDAANSVMDTKFAGKYCEHIATVFCSSGGSSTAYSAGKSFCTNEGKCKPKEYEGQEIFGCICTEGWEGPHCETSTLNNYSLTDLAVDATNAGMDWLIAGVVCAVVFSILGFCIWRDRREKKRQRRTRMEMGGMRASPHTMV